MQEAEKCIDCKNCKYYKEHGSFDNIDIFDILAKREQERLKKGKQKYEWKTGTNINTKTWTKKVKNVRFINFSNTFCFNSAIVVVSIYFFFACICPIILAIIQYIV